MTPREAMVEFLTDLAQLRRLELQARIDRTRVGADEQQDDDSVEWFTGYYSGIVSAQCAFLGSTDDSGRDAHERVWRMNFNARAIAADFRHKMNPVGEAHDEAVAEQYEFWAAVNSSLQGLLDDGLVGYDSEPLPMTLVMMTRNAAEGFWATIDSHYIVTVKDFNMPAAHYLETSLARAVVVAELALEESSYRSIIGEVAITHHYGKRKMDGWDPDALNTCTAGDAPVIRKLTLREARARNFTPTSMMLNEAEKAALTEMQAASAAASDMLDDDMLEFQDMEVLQQTLDDIAKHADFLNTVLYERVCAIQHEKGE